MTAAATEEPREGAGVRRLTSWTPSRAVQDYSALALLAFGHVLLLGPFAVAGWLAGLLLLIPSRTWPWSIKLLGVLTLPGGIALAIYADDNWVPDDARSQDRAYIAYWVAVFAACAFLAFFRVWKIHRCKPPRPQSLLLRGRYM